TYYNITVPANTKADIYLPASKVEDVTENEQALAADKDVTSGTADSGYIVIHAGSGTYHFAVNTPATTTQVQGSK
ncbi:MAG: hypothetical protein JST32_20905, partial [Bacteroidetes bacterium]|nr:hypothetical protein [Bacteroidota bacterium]